MAPEIKHDLRTHSRFVTTHNNDGKAIFSNAFPEPAPVRQVMGGDMLFSLMYTTRKNPVSMAGDEDMQVYQDYLTTPPAITIENGTTCRTVDFPPDYSSPMHRTPSCDFGIVIEGEVELILDSGEKRLLKRGDVAVQRGTNHAWHNTSKTSWARMFYVLQAADKLVIGDKVMEEDEGGID